MKLEKWRNIQDETRKGKWNPLPSNAACTLRFKLRVVEALTDGLAATVAGPPMDEGGLFRLITVATESRLLLISHTAL